MHGNKAQPRSALFPLVFLTCSIFSSRDPELALSLPQNCLRKLTYCLWPNIDSGLRCKKILVLVSKRDDYHTLCLRLSSGPLNAV